ncbi:MAG: cell division protein FtsX [Bacteroidota bacterium]
MSTPPVKFKVRKKKLGSYPFVSVVFSVTLALFVIGAFGALVIYSKELERSVRENVRVQVFLKNISEAQRVQLEKKLSTQAFVLKRDQKPVIQFVSKQEAAKQFIKDTGEDFQKFLGDNPLRDAYLVNVDAKYHDAKSMEKIKADVEQIEGVFQVFYVENVVASINKNVTRIGFVLMGLALLLLIVVVVLIHNTLRLALFSQRFLIRSMQLVGAKKWFIQGPFITRAALHGTLAGILAGGLLIALIYAANKRVEELALIQNNTRLAALIGSLVVIGIFVAVLSTYSAVSKYLKLSLDELY